MKLLHRLYFYALKYMYRECPNNYFYTTNVIEIEKSIHDKNDIEPSKQQYYGEVFYDPFLTEEYPYAGIQEE